MKLTCATHSNQPVKCRHQCDLKLITNVTQYLLPQTLQTSVGVNDAGSGLKIMKFCVCVNPCSTSIQKCGNGM